MKYLIFLIFLMGVVSVTAQAPPVGSSGCVAGYDAWGNVVPCGYSGDNTLPWVMAFAAFCVFMAFMIPRSKTPVHSPPQHHQTTLSEKKGHIVKPTKVAGKGSYGHEAADARPSTLWGYLSLIIGIGAVVAVLFYLSYPEFIPGIVASTIGILAVILYFIQQRYSTTWPSLIGLFLGFFGFSYPFLDLIAWDFGYTMMYIYLGLLLFALYVIISKRKR
ncbi:hypothetical protein ISS07_00050 [Candidatus Woesearchaeota archaeon]|nr:hypothetical protein [Candidatus Woesearchaeota archaeon]